MRSWPLLLAVVACAATACQRNARPADEPDPRVLELEKRVTRLEAATESLDALANRMAELAEALSALSSVQPAVAEPDADRHEELDHDARLRLAEIDDKLDAIERRLGAGPGAPAVPARPARPPGPDPNAVYAIPVAGSPFEGPRHAKVTIVKAFEFACPYCHRVRGTLEQLQKDYGTDLRIVYKNLVVHPGTATIPAHAACAAHRQGKFAEMKALIWDKGFSAGRNLSQANMDTLAGELGLDMSRFHADMNGPCKRVVADDMALMNKFGARGTPAFFINGRFLSGARPIDQFKAVIDDELAKANKRLRKKGSRVSRYYNTWIVGKGKKSL